jgi:hypothetical protein
MSMKMLPFREAHLDEASSLVARSYAGMRRMIGSLCATASGVAAVEHDELHGFVLGMHPEDWRGQRTAYVPEWAHGRGRGDLSDFLERMYAAMAAEWVSAGYTWHLITAATDADDAMYALRWMGFGMCGLDAVLDLARRDPTLPPGRLKGTRARRAGPADLETVAHLAGELRRYMAGPPLFVPKHDSAEPYLQEWLQGRTGAVWLAERDGRAVGMMGVGPGGDDRCQWVQNEGTAGIRPAYIEPSERNAGLGTLLLLRCIGWARAAHSKRLAVDL